MIDWAHSGAVVIAAFLASLVEFVEALTIVLAAGSDRRRCRGSTACGVGGYPRATVVSIADRVVADDGRHLAAVVRDALAAQSRAALVAVVAVGLMAHRPLAQVPENTLKFTVGVLWSGFGVFWLGEGAGLAWPGEDLAIVGLIAGFMAAALLAVQLARRATAAKESL